MSRLYLITSLLFLFMIMTFEQVNANEGEQPKIVNVEVISNNESSIIDSIEVSPKEANVGDTVTVKVKASDEQSGIERAYVLYKPLLNQPRQELELSYDSNEEIWIGTLIVKENFKDGTWIIDEVSIIDKSENKINLRPIDFPDPSQFNFIIHNENWIPPTLESLELSPKQVHVGDKLQIKAKVKNGIHGVKKARIAFYFDLGDRSKINDIILKYNEETGLWIGEYLIKDTDIDGTWKLESYQMEDNNGNIEYVHARNDAIYSDYYYIVNNPNEVDVTPPNLESIEITPKVVEVGQDIIIKAKVSDESEVQQVSFTFDKPKVGIKNSISLNYDESSDFWIGNYLVKSHDISGIWKFGELQIYDSLGNGQVINNSNISDLTNLEVEVINPSGGDFTPPDIESITLSPRNVNVSETIYIKAKINDDISGVSFVDVFFNSTSTNSVRSIVLEDQDQNGIWEGSYKTTILDNEGKWLFITINIQDEAGNYTTFKPDDFINGEELNFTLSHKLPFVNEVTDQTIEISGKAIGGLKVKVNVGEMELGSAVVHADGTFRVPISQQDAGTVLSVTFIDGEGKVIEEKSVTVVNSGQPIDECFIATAAYGSKFEPSVVILRSFRDNFLMTNTMGQSFVKFYYKNSPPIANIIADSEFLKTIVKILLIPFISVAYFFLNPQWLGILILPLLLIIYFRIKRLKLIHFSKFE